MAITFARLVTRHLTQRSGAVRNLAYTARTAIYDPRLDTVFDYACLQGDLACHGIILPEGYPPRFAELDALAAALDLAEWAKVRTPLEQRTRPPQVGLALVVALPPSDELWLHEAAELFQRIVTEPSGSRTVPIHWAIHNADINCHGHAYYGLRVFDAEGRPGHRVRNFIARLRPSRFGTEVFEGVDWPSLVWETQQAYFEELGLELVVDPIAPAPGLHLSPVVYANGTIHNERTREQVLRARQQAHTANVAAIEGSPAELIEILLRGRSSLRVSELERLSAKFFDHPAERASKVERVLGDDEIVTMAENGAEKPRYLTTRRIHVLLTNAAQLIDDPGQQHISTITARDSASLVERLARHYFTGNYPSHPLILGHALSDCEGTALALAAREPFVGTIDMAVTGSDSLLATGRRRDLAFRPGRPVIVPHSERIDDQRLAQLLLEAKKHDVQLIFGHDQCRRHGIVARRLAAYAADRATPNSERYERNDIERLLRAGLVGLAIAAMADHGLLKFDHGFSRDIENPMCVVACQSRRRMRELADAIREQRVRSKISEAPEQMTTLRGTLSLSVGEWIVTTEACNAPALPAGQFARLVAVDRSVSVISVIHDGEIKKIDLDKFAAIRSASTLTIREARGLPLNMRLVVELAKDRHIWSSLLLVARHAHAELYVDPALATSAQELAEIAGRSLPGALPHEREMKPDSNAEIGKILLALQSKDPVETELFPEAPVAAPAPPQPIHMEERIRGMIASNSEGYRLLHNHVGHHNPARQANAAHILGLSNSNLLKALVRFLADHELERPRDELDDLDLPVELSELDPMRWTYGDIENARYELYTMAIPGSEWGLKPPLPPRNMTPVNSADT
ncbi:MobA/MobL family protein [Bradyrhizobium canariense]|uniref:MobA/MobL family protein n=1 Tax=Bradyrhizobium canariense TaxID=255045 RepID=UPI000A19ABFB|nr:MobA/MobL family protein [Bradyrhizobium canariense]OSJ07803.1 hypothetical protein BSR47_39475 [Bradyrhizobium canariense]